MKGTIVHLYEDEMVGEAILTSSPTSYDNSYVEIADHNLDPSKTYYLNYQLGDRQTDRFEMPVRSEELDYVVHDTDKITVKDVKPGATVFLVSQPYLSSTRYPKTQATNSTETMQNLTLTFDTNHTFHFAVLEEGKSLSKFITPNRYSR